MYHRLSGNIPEVVTDKARGRSPRALSVTTEGISQYSQACLRYNLFVAKATGARCKLVLTGLASTQYSTIHQYYSTTVLLVRVVAGAVSSKARCAPILGISWCLEWDCCKRVKRSPGKPFHSP